MRKELNKEIEKIFNNSPLLKEKIAEILEKTFKRDLEALHHSLRTAEILKKTGGDEITISAAILHHVPLSEPLLDFLPPQQKTEILEVVNKIQRLREFSSLKKEFKVEPLKKWEKNFLDTQAQNLRGMFFAIAGDLRPILVLLADKLDEMRYLHLCSPDEIKHKCTQALKVFAPLAYGIGMGEIKGELEDLAFPHLYPKEYEWLLSNVKDRYSERERYIEKIKPIALKSLKKERIKVIDLHARAKHYFSLYQKLLRYDMDIERIYDLVALRIIVPKSSTCYKTIGVLHKQWMPLPGRIKDYIASPKPNGYRSLHTTVVCEEKKIVEFQIKTPLMHKEAEYGAAAHLSYKEHISSTRRSRKQFYWMNQIRKWKEEIKDPHRVSQYIRFELFQDQIFTLTPKGDIINLPKNATPVDFAYAIHSEIGDHCAGAKVNGKIVSLDFPLKNGDRVAILTEKNKTPTSHWLRFVKTAKAKSKIRGFLKRAYGISPVSPGKKLGLAEKVSLIKKVLPFKRKKEEILIGGQSGISVKIAKCCSPKKGDDIVAFITQGEGASLHKKDCKNLNYIKKKWPMKIVQASWGKKEN